MEVKLQMNEMVFSLASFLGSMGAKVISDE